MEHSDDQPELGVCPYCARPLSAEETNSEHVIPAELGGTLEVRTHLKCNGEVATVIDNPLMGDPDVQMLRALSGAINVRNKKPFRGSQWPGRLPDGSKALLKASPEGLSIEQVTPSVPEPDENGNFVFSMPADDVEKRMARVLEDLQARFPGKEISIASQGERTAVVGIERSWELEPWVWPRFAAKIAACVLQLAMPPSWSGSNGEISVLALVRHGHVQGTVGGVSAFPEQLEAGDSWFDGLYPWEHVLAVTREEDHVKVMVVLFGGLRYDLRVLTDLEPTGPVAWLCDFREKRPAEFASVRDLALALTERIAEHGPVGLALRREYPRGQRLGPNVVARFEGM
ncbi:MAG: hypothetical protein Q7T73_22505 [Beijerinckiaceae bacterium]|nr:hypothetical protein [Beijerinckiaceae bacterium]